MIRASAAPDSGLDSTDVAAIDGLTEAVQSVLPALEMFIRFDQPERTGMTRAVWSRELDEPLPTDPAGAEVVLGRLRDVVIPHGLRAGAPGFSGWVATMPTTLPAVAHLASALAGPLSVGVQSFNLLESVGLRWLAQLVGIPSTYQGVFTSAGSIANLIGLGAARQYAAELRGVDPARDGLSGLPKPRIYASVHVHHCSYRAAGVLGLGRRAVVTLPTDSRFRLDVAALRRQIEQDLRDGCSPVAVVATTGTVYSGAIDPLPEISALCREHNIWLHVDGAYGLFGILDPAVAPLYGDLRLADSLVVDPHKWLATSMGCGSVFVRDGGLLGRAFTLEPALYIEQSQPEYADGQPLTSQFDDFGYAFHHFGLEHSLPSRGVEVWAVLKEIGASGMAERVIRHNAFASYCGELVQSSATLKLVAPPSLSTCCFQYIPAELRGQDTAASAELVNYLNRSVLGRIRARGRCIPSATVLDGAFALRACFVNPRTSRADVEALVAEAEASGAEVWAAHQAG
ncbi:MAG: aspartate aminotransferase family protein [Roseiflexaceae bacterium]